MDYGKVLAFELSVAYPQLGTVTVTKIVSPPDGALFHRMLADSLEELRVAANAKTGNTGRLKQVDAVFEIADELFSPIQIVRRVRGFVRDRRDD